MRILSSDEHPACSSIDEPAPVIFTELLQGQGSTLREQHFKYFYMLDFRFKIVKFSTFKVLLINVICDFQFVFLLFVVLSLFIV